MKLNWQMRLDVRVWVLVEGILILFNSNLNIFLSRYYKSKIDFNHRRKQNAETILQNEKSGQNFIILYLCNKTFSAAVMGKNHKQIVINPKVMVSNQTKTGSVVLQCCKGEQ